MMLKKNKTNSKLIIGLIFLAVYISYSYVSSLYDSYKVDIQERSIQKEISRLKEENDRIKKQINYITTPSFIEREAKRELDLKKPDEEVTIIRGKDSIIKTDIPEEKPEWQNLSNPERWILFFSGKNTIEKNIQ